MPSSALSVDRALTPTIAEIRLDHLRHNVRTLQRLAAPAAVMAVVKADAYGHGAARAAPLLAEEGIRQFAVATVGEGVALCEAGITGRILVLGAPLPGALPDYQHHGLEVNVCSRAIAEAVCQLASPAAPLRVQLKVDTGMSRLGMAPDDVPAVLAQLRAAAGVEVTGLWSHYATATSTDDAFAAEQANRFAAVVRALPAPLPPLHIGHSGGLLMTDEAAAPFNGHPMVVRPGIALYGVAPSPALADAADLRTVMRLVSRVTQVKTVPAGASVSYGRTWTAPRPTRLAIIGAGYADGYPRALSNTASIGLHDALYPVVGTVCMDMCMVDLGPPETAPAVEPGDTAVLFGTGGPSLSDVAAWAGTIPYELCTRIGPRVPKVYI
ncbi:MAG: alanine racemase [Bacteroidetes bacterium]|jgi:alanine racemase|nr:alanine racemase [Bacteroidota bacterium]